MITSLASLQQCFQDYLLHQNPTVLQEVVTDLTASAATRLDIYGTAYRLRLLESLQHDYPIVAKLMGEDRFQHLGKKYIDRNPSVHRSIRWFGTHFPAFLKEATLEYQGFWQEIAHFEQALATSFDAEDTPHLYDTAIQAIPPEKWAQMKFQFHPAFQVLECEWNALRAWKAAQSSKLQRFCVKKYNIPQTWMLWRFELETYFSRLKASEAWAVRAAQAGLPFGEICEGLGRWISQDQLIMHAASLLKSWIDKGLITKIEIQPLNSVP